MYLPDLSPYVYRRVSGRVLAVGWLDRDHAFPKADSAQEALERDLRRALARGKVNQMRGYHYCGFCDDESPTAPGLRFPLGSAELWIPSESGDVFAAPDLVYHYVAAHGYRPPSVFIEALASLDMENWDPEATFDAASK